jgi:hypothetical protein
MIAPEARAVIPRRGASPVGPALSDRPFTYVSFYYDHWRVIPIMTLFTRGSLLALLSFWVIGLAGCGEDNEAAFKEQAAKAKGTIPGSRTAQAQTQSEYYEITPGVQGAGTKSGPRPDQGTGYPGANR